MTMMAWCEVDDPSVVVTIRYPDPENPAEVLDLDLPADCPEDGVGAWWQALQLPAFGMRYTYAPPSRIVAGQAMLGAVVDSSTVPLRVAVRGSDAADLQARRDALTAALASYPLVVRITATYGEDTPHLLGEWAAQPSLPVWDDALSPNRLTLHTLQATLSIPVNPPGAPVLRYP